MEGDYRDPPPPGKYAKLYDQSKRSMKRPPVKLKVQARRLACRAMAEGLLHHGIELVDLSVGVTHFHVLARFAPLTAAGRPSVQDLKRTARHYLGVAKKVSSRTLSDAGLVRRGGVWGVRGLERPVRNRAHQLNVAQYIRDHAKEGAVVWSTISKESQ
ncbi:MAG: hypothetical protein ISS78_00765 [Phycisphaerae bacterium]|nr:hypothetical protein [Phycisphaerae bacterium]